MTMRSTSLQMLAFLVVCACGSGAQSPVTPGAARSATGPSVTASAPVSSALARTPVSRPALVDPESRVAWAPRAKPEEVALDREALERLIAACETTDTHALIVIAKGRTVVERRFGRDEGPIDLMSVTKGIVGLAIGKLVAEGKIRSLDTPLSTWFPEWKLGNKAKVTLRHVLTHTSGLEHKAAAGELTRQRDRLAYVRALPIVTTPGEVFSYNNEATQLLSGVVQKASGQSLDAYASEQILSPLGIVAHPWVRDEVGTPPAFWGLSLDAADLAKVGAMLLARGRWNDRQVLPESWIDEMQKPASQNASWHGLLAWLLYDGPYRVQTPESRKPFGEAGFTAVEKLAPLDGKRFSSHAAYWLEAGALLDTSERAALAGMIRDDRLPYTSPPAKQIGFDFNGWLGQYLVVLPEAGVVAVRLRRAAPGGGDDADNTKNGMRDFTELLAAATR